MLSGLRAKGELAEVLTADVLLMSGMGGLAKTFLPWE